MHPFPLPVAIGLNPPESEDNPTQIDVCDAKTETAASSENSGRKSTENEQLEVLYEHTICAGVSQ